MFSDEAKKHFKKRIEENLADARELPEDNFSDKDSYLNAVMMAERLKGNLRAHLYAHEDEDDREDQYYGMRLEADQEGMMESDDQSDFSSSLMTRDTFLSHPG
jgi:hypothetical protein